MEVPKSKSAGDWFGGEKKPSGLKGRPRGRKKPPGALPAPAEVFEAKKLGEYRRAGEGGLPDAKTKLAENPLARDSDNLGEAPSQEPGTEKPPTKPKPPAAGKMPITPPKRPVRKFDQARLSALKQEVAKKAEKPDVESNLPTQEASAPPPAPEPAISSTDAEIALPKPAPARKAPEPSTCRAAPVLTTPVKKKFFGKKKPALDTAKQSAALAETMVGSFIDRLKSECQKKGGTLKLEDLEALSEDFRKKTVSLQKVFQLSFDETIRAREQSILNNKRNDAFERLMVQTVSHLLCDDDVPPVHGKSLSRRMLPGFFLALDKMLGDEIIDKFRRDIERIVDQISTDNGDAFDWEDVYQSIEAQSVVLKALITSAYHFDNLKRRSEWLITVINSHLGPMASSMHKSHQAWQFTAKDFNAFLIGYFAPMSETLGTEAGRMRITKMYGVETVVVLADLLQALHKKAGK